MSALLKSLPKPPTEVNGEWVTLLEEALAAAKDGTCLGGAIVQDFGGSASHATIGIKNRWEFVGHLMKLVDHLVGE